jgi:hypothetical protein
MLSSILLLSLSLGSAIATTPLPKDYRIDAHRHAIPDIWYDALVSAGFPVVNGTLEPDGFPTPRWTIEGHIAEMDTQNVNYSIIGINGPGVDFLSKEPAAAAALARKINLEMYNYTQQYPTRVGAYCLVPLPDINSSLIEIQVFLSPPKNFEKTKTDTKIVLPRRASLRWRGSAYQL